MPGPLSRTSRLASPAAVIPTEKLMVVAGGAKEAALASRLSRIWTSLPSWTLTSTGSSTASNDSVWLSVVGWRAATKLSTRSRRSILVADSVAISLSRRLARDISVINRSSRTTSRRMIFISFFCCFWSEMRLIVSVALRSDDSGFFSSCDTSAAKPAVAAIRF